MTHEIWHIICGGVGKILAWLPLKDGDTTVLIPKYSRLFFNVIYSTEGLSHEEIEKIDKDINKLRHKLYKKFSRPGDDIHYQSPEPPHEH
jgi:hypothetical protein